DLDAPVTESTSPGQTFVTLPNGRAGRKVTVIFHPRLEDEAEPDPQVDSDERPVLVLSVARQTTELDGTLSTLRWLLLAVTTAAVLGSILLASGVIRREMRPLETLARSIERVGATDLSQRIAVNACPDEIVPVVQRLNE